MGLTVAEAFMLLAFVLLMLMMLWRNEDARRLEAVQEFTAMSQAEKAGMRNVLEVFRQAGISPEDPQLAEKLGDLAAIGESGADELLSRLAAADDAERRKLEALVRSDVWRHGSAGDVLAHLNAANETDRRKLEALVRSDMWRDESADEVLAKLAAANAEERERLNELIGSEVWRDGGEDRTVAERVAGRLQAAAESRQRVTEALRRQLGPAVAAAGGEIDADGALVFPETVLFAAGRSDVTPQLRAFLGSICLPWFQTLERSGAEISDLRIEGHASTEWTGLSPEQAYLANLALSQARAHAVLSTCLELVPGPEGEWARSVATAVGYSSSHPVVVSGQEDKQKSRRVVFRVDYSQEGVLRDIQTDVDAAESPATPSGRPPAPGAPAAETIAPAPGAAEAAPPVAAPAAPAVTGAASAAREPLPAPDPDRQTMAATDAGTGGKAPGLAGIASVIDGDTIEIRGTRIRLFGIDAPERGQTCKTAAGESYFCGQTAALALADLIRNQIVTCDPKGVGASGATFAACTVGGKDIGGWMVGEGLAFAARRDSSDYVPAEEAARRNAAGLWAGTFELPRDVR